MRIAAVDQNAGPCDLRQGCDDLRQLTCELREGGQGEFTVHFGENRSHKGQQRSWCPHRVAKRVPLADLQGFTNPKSCFLRIRLEIMIIG